MRVWGLGFRLEIQLQDVAKINVLGDPGIWIKNVSSVTDSTKDSAGGGG